MYHAHQAFEPAAAPLDIITKSLYNQLVMTSLDTAFFALSDPTRRAILARLATGDLTVMELAEPFEMSQPAISRHLRVLEEAKLISRRTEGTTRPCRLEADGMHGVEQWLATMRDALSRSFDRLDHVLASMQAETRRAKPARHTRNKTPRKRSTRK